MCYQIGVAVFGCGPFCAFNIKRILGNKRTFPCSFGNKRMRLLTRVYGILPLSLLWQSMPGDVLCLESHPSSEGSELVQLDTDILPEISQLDASGKFMNVAYLYPSSLVI